MGFFWPFALLALLALPVLAWWYLRNLSRPSEAVAMHPDLELLLRANASSGFSWRRTLPAILYLGALALKYKIAGRTRRQENPLEALARSNNSRSG